MKETNNQQYLSFLLDDEEYCVNILAIQEIKGWVPVKPIPDAPDFLKGVVNLRGTVIPIVDLRVRFNIASVEYGATTVVIVVNIKTSNETTRIAGIVVDAVSEVYDFSEKDIQSEKNIVSGINESFIEGIATINEKMVTVINIDRVFDFDSISSVELKKAVSGEESMKFHDK